METPAPPPIKTLTAIHVAARSGISMSIAPGLRWLAEAGEVHTILPEDGPGRQRLRAVLIDLDYALRGPDAARERAQGSARRRGCGGRSARFRGKIREL